MIRLLRPPAFPAKALGVGLYFGVVGVCLAEVDWAATGVAWLALAFLAGMWVADFLTGLAHLAIDYRALNFQQGFGRLFDYDGPRGGEAFIQLKRQVVKGARWLDTKVYTFKIHHRQGRSNRHSSYADALLEFMPAALAILLLGLGLEHALGRHPAVPGLLVFHVAVSVFLAHAQPVHYCLHGSEAMPRGTRWMRALSRHGLIYSSHTHAEHHREGLVGFCLVTGHANFAVDGLCRWLLQTGRIHRADWSGRPRA
jgi:hypothetical protein